MRSLCHPTNSLEDPKPLDSLSPKEMFCSIQAHIALEEVPFFSSMKRSGSTSRTLKNLRRQEHLLFFKTSALASYSSSRIKLAKKLFTIAKL